VCACCVCVCARVCVCVCVCEAEASGENALIVNAQTIVTKTEVPSLISNFQLARKTDSDHLAWDKKAIMVLMLKHKSLSGEL